MAAYVVDNGAFAPIADLTGLIQPVRSEHQTPERPPHHRYMNTKSHSEENDVGGREVHRPAEPMGYDAIAS